MKKSPKKEVSVETPTPIISAPLCLQCNGEMPNGLLKYPELAVCENPACPNYGVFQVGVEIMSQMYAQKKQKESNYSHV